MSIFDTEKLTQARCDLANVGIRAFHLPVGERNSLAEFYGLGVRTVSRWFAGPGEQYRRCIPRYAWQAVLPPETTPGLRIYLMFDANNPSGRGDGKPASKGGGDLQNLRLRCILAAALGVEGGLEREPAFTGRARKLDERFGSLAESMQYINNVYTGVIKTFLANAWYRIEIFPDPSGEGWYVWVSYNEMAPGDASDPARDIRA